jgi:hypothetical protein
MLSKGLSCCIPSNICYFSRVKFVEYSVTYKNVSNEINEESLTGKNHEVVVALNFEGLDVRVSHYHSRVPSVFKLFGFDVTKGPRN